MQPQSVSYYKKNENALWTIAAETAVVELKNAVITVSISKLVDPNKNFVVTTDMLE